MKSYLIVSILIALRSQTSYGQNLVYNGDFEETIKCVSEYGEIEASKGWLQLDGSSDYYNSCNKEKNFVGVPYNYNGFQVAHSGIGYAGFYLFSFNKMDEKKGLYNREYLLRHTAFLPNLDQ